MDGHADTAPGTDGLAELAGLLDDTPQGTVDEDKRDLAADNATDDNVDTAEEANAQSDDPEAEGEEPEAEGENPDEPAPERTHKITVKGEDGEESTIEVGDQELIKGYQRQADYTRKTQELAAREDQAVQFLKGKHQEVQSHYIERAEATRLAVIQMAGIKTDEEMAQLAQSDPQAWVAESQRQRSVYSFLSQLDQQIAGEKQRMAQEREASVTQAKKQAYQKTWNELHKAKIDKTALGKIYSEAANSYGFTPQELGEVYDHRIVMLMRDAAAYKQLQAQKKEVTRKVEAAPRLPAKQASTGQERRSKELEARFKGGKAKLADLAAYLM